MAVLFIRFADRQLSKPCELEFPFNHVTSALARPVCLKLVIRVAGRCRLSKLIEWVDNTAFEVTGLPSNTMIRNHGKVKMRCNDTTHTTFGTSKKNYQKVWGTPEPERTAVCQDGKWRFIHNKKLMEQRQKCIDQSTFNLTLLICCAKGSERWVFVFSWLCSTWIIPLVWYGVSECYLPFIDRIDAHGRLAKAKIELVRLKYLDINTDKTVEIPNEPVKHLFQLQSLRVKCKRGYYPATGSEMTLVCLGSMAIILKDKKDNETVVTENWWPQLQCEGEKKGRFPGLTVSTFSLKNAQ